MLSLKLRTLYILCMGIRPTVATQIPTYLDFYQTLQTPLTSTIESGQVATIVGTYEIILILVCIMTLLAALMFSYNLIRDYKRWVRRIPRTDIFLRFPLQASSIYIHFMTLPDTLACYTFSMSDGPKEWKIKGYLAPELFLDWQGITIRHNLLQKEIPTPKSIPISRADAYKLKEYSRCFSGTPELPKPLLYSYWDKESYPQVITVLPHLTDDGHTPSAPQIESMKTQGHLYAIV